MSILSHMKETISARNASIVGHIGAKKMCSKHLLLSLPYEMIDYILDLLDLVDGVALSTAGVWPCVHLLLRQKLNRTRKIDLTNCPTVTPQLFTHLMSHCVDLHQLSILNLSRFDTLPAGLLVRVFQSATGLKELYLEETQLVADPPSSVGRALRLVQTCYHLFRKQLSRITLNGQQYYCSDASKPFFVFPERFQMTSLRKLGFKSADPSRCRLGEYFLRINIFCSLQLTSLVLDLCPAAVHELVNVCPNLEYVYIQHSSDFSRIPWEKISRLQFLRELSIDCDARLNLTHFRQVSSKILFLIDLQIY